MSDLIQAIVENAAAFRWLLLAAAVWIFYRVVMDTEGIEFADFIAVERDGKYHGDPAKLGQTLGVAAATFTIVMTLPMAYKDFVGFAAVLGVCFSGLFGTYAFIANVKSKVGQTVTVTKPAAEPGPVETTVTKSAPSKDDPIKVELAKGPGKDAPMPVKETSKRKKT